MMKRIRITALFTLIVSCLLFNPHAAFAENRDEQTYISTSDYIDAVTNENKRFGIEFEVVGDQESEAKLTVGDLNREIEQISEASRQAALATVDIVDLDQNQNQQVFRAMPYSKEYTKTIRATSVPALAYTDITYVVQATVNAQTGTLISINNAYSYVSYAVNLESWQQTKLDTSRTYLYGNEFVKAHIVGFANFRYTHPSTGLTVSATVPVDHITLWATE